MMPAKAEHGGRRSQHSEQEVFQANVYSQPWWHTGPNDPTAAAARKASKLSFASQTNGSLVNGAAQSGSYLGNYCYLCCDFHVTSLRP